MSKQRDPKTGRFVSVKNEFEQIAESLATATPISTIRMQLPNEFAWLPMACVLAAAFGLFIGYLL